MLKLILVITGLLAVSFICSILESVILSITRPYIQVLIDKKERTGAMLQNMKEHIDEPIAAILTLNTISHTAGAAVSGAIALQLFGSEWMALFSGVLTLLILIFSEIIPKTIGASYWKKLSPLSAWILRGMIIFLKPLIVPINFLSKAISHGETSDGVTRAEIKNYIRLGHRQGSIEKNEYRIVDNLFSLKSVTVGEIMTPRSVVCTLDDSYRVSDISEKKIDIYFSRIPLFNVKEDKVTGIVMHRQIMETITEGNASTELKSIARDPSFVHEDTPVYNILNYMIAQKIHICIVNNEAGTYTGIITLEDALETLLGKEIVDEFDQVADMRDLAE